ncbi:hypothetical protein ACXJJ3_30240 [Kribbella sp. WER1]
MGSPLRIVLMETAPSEPEDSWEDVVEVSIDVPAGADAGWSSWAGESGGRLEGLAAGSYRLRLSARGRDAGRDGEFEEGLVDAYSSSCGRPMPRLTRSWRVGSHDDVYWHDAWGNRRT